ncbi:MAG TPA: zinc-binding dehydrogenase [Myxococcales bacterium]|jgi:NADPH:quinone reductase-like Zn-dependent oxidoreductase
MRQLVVTKKGGPEVLQVREAPDPAPKPGEVRIRVHAAGLNFADVIARLGFYPDAPPFPAVLGYEVAGEIDLPQERRGERVIAATRFGGQSELVCVAAEMVYPLPEPLSFAEGASIPVVWLTAFHMLVELANLKAGQTVLIHAAAGGVGTAALQIARRIGARSIGTASASKHERLRELGLSDAIDYRKEDFEARVRELTSGRGVDVVLDATGAFKKSYRCLAPMGKLIMFGASGVVAGGTRDIVRAARTIVSMPFFHPLKMLPDNKAVFGVNMGRLWGEAALLKREMEEIMRGFAGGDYRAIVDCEVPFAEAPRAQERLTSRANFGKVLLVP